MSETLKKIEKFLFVFIYFYFEFRKKVNVISVFGILVENKGYTYNILQLIIL